MSTTYSGSPARDPEPAALADGEAVLAAVAPEHVALPVDDRPGRVAEPAVAREEPGAVGAGEEAQVLGVGLGGDRQPGRRRQLA